MTEEENNKPQLNKDHAHRVIRHPLHCSSRIRPQDHCQQSVLLQHSAEFEKEHSAKAAGSVAREELFSTTLFPVTMHSFFVTFSLTTTCYLFDTRAIRQIYFMRTSSFFLT